MNPSSPSFSLRKEKRRYEKNPPDFPNLVEFGGVWRYVNPLKLHCTPPKNVQAKIGWKKSIQIRLFYLSTEPTAAAHLHSLFKKESTREEGRGREEGERNTSFSTLLEIWRVLITKTLSLFCSLPPFLPSLLFPHNPLFLPPPRCLCSVFCLAILHYSIGNRNVVLPPYFIHLLGRRVFSAVHLVHHHTMYRE